jgi:hypothetical protein
MGRVVSTGVALALAFAFENGTVGTTTIAAIGAAQSAVAARASDPSSSPSFATAEVVVVAFPVLTSLCVMYLRYDKR